MFPVYRPDASFLRWASSSVRSTLLGLAATAVALPLCALIFAFIKFESVTPVTLPFVQGLIVMAGLFVTISILSFIFAAAVYFLYDDADRIRFQVLRGLCCPAYGNPLHLKAGEYLPTVVCRCIDNGIYHLIVRPNSGAAEDVAKIAPHISACLKGRFKNYAVTQADISVDSDRVTFTLENVTIDRSLTVCSADELRPGGPTKLIVQDGTYIDLTTSGSMLFAGKTRSGKTTAIISLLLQVLQAGRDDYGSEVILADPKCAETSRVGNTVTLDKDGKATAILDTLRYFAKTATDRQQILNDMSEKSGDAVHWWEAGMHPSFLFLDEYVACRTMFPQKPPKGDEDYCLATFDALIKRLVTMGASAGCYVIISIAEASVQDGGLPSMLRSAMSTKVLMRPTMPEARLLWSPEQLEALAASARVYGPGDAWFSSTDGVHDNVSYVHFPRMNFAVYRELGRLLAEYYGD